MLTQLSGLDANHILQGRDTRLLDVVVHRDADRERHRRSTREGQRVAHA